ncbi:MAG: hypothetical protein LBU65_10315 [Planctomycetaceae bacterium]|jgi:hypothetical protein|nr:hypothetical protein [Planctomycetaceae bacterium]
MLPLTWDEGEYIDRAGDIVSGVPPFEWKAVTYSEGHPAGNLLVIAAGRFLTRDIVAFFPGIITDKISWRFGTMLFVATALGAVFCRVCHEYDISTAIFSLTAALLFPRFFAHAHIAASDAPLAAATLLAWAMAGGKTWSFGHCALFGVCLGVTMSMKFTGLITVSVLLTLQWFGIGWRFDVGEWRWNITRIALCLTTIFAASALFCVMNPPLWENPVTSLFTFVRLNLFRDNYNVSTMFLGQMYDLHRSLPFYNTIVWAAITTPVGFLPLLVIGIVYSFYKRRNGGLLLIAAAFLLVRSLPHTPPHDGVRLFLPAFPTLAILIGIGAGQVWNVIAHRISGYNKILARTAIAVIWLSGVWNLVTFAPQWLSYYNLTIGGLNGSSNVGMERTYWWDTLDSETLNWINTNTPPNERIAFAPFSRKTIDLYRNWGYLKPETTTNIAAARYYVIQFRGGALFPSDREIIKNCSPVYTKQLHGVVLLAIYEVRDM